MEHPVLQAIRRASFTPFGWFESGPDERVPGNGRFLILIGNAGPDMFRRFMRDRASAKTTLDEWTEVSVSRLAEDLDARACFPFEKPFLPFQAWARRAGAGHVSPLGLNIHPTYGLWHAYRAALVFPVAFDLPKMSSGAHPCESCSTKPCLSACPVHAFTGGSYEVQACAGHLSSGAGQDCMQNGCLARRACPVGQAFAYAPAQMQFHMNAFLAARKAAED
jgi:epoxyqueuosine reductase QueG